MALDGKTINDLLWLGVLSMSFSPNDTQTMRQAVAEMASKPLNSTITAVMQEKIRAKGRDTPPELALAVLNLFLEAKTEPARGPQLKETLHAWNWMIVAVTLVTVILKIVSKRLLKGKLGWDDYTLIIAGAMCFGYYLVIYLGSYQSEQCDHVWDVSWHGYKEMIKALFDIEVAYVFANLASKIALTMFYLTIFPKELSFRYHKIINYMIIFLIVDSLAILGTVVFQCTPVDWWKDPLHAKCLPRMAFWATQAGIVLLANIVVMVLPLKIVWQLKLTRAQKWMVTGLFALGTLAWAACIYRVIQMQKWLNDEADWTRAQCFAATPSLLECCLTVIAACVPAIKALIWAYVPKLQTRIHSIRQKSSAGPDSTIASIAEIVQPSMTSKVTSETRETVEQYHHHHTTPINNKPTPHVHGNQNNKYVDMFRDLHDRSVYDARTTRERLDQGDTASEITISPSVDDDVDIEHGYGALTPPPRMKAARILGN